jgi:hypothetical protein
MNQDNTTHRRIVVTLDSAEVDRAELERLARLARRIGARLEGVFVEDSDLLRLAGLTFLREYRPTSQRAEPFEVGRMQQELRAMARRAERLLSEYAEHSGIECSFRVWRGSIERELLTGVEADILAVMRLGAIAARPARRQRHETVSAYFDGSQESVRGLVTAADVAADYDDVALQVLLAHEADDSRGGLRERAEEILADYAGKVVYRSLEDDSVGGLLTVVRDSGTTALVMQRDNDLLRNTSLREYLSRLHCPLFLVR